MKKAFAGLYTSYVDTVALVIKYWKKFLPLILIPAILSFILTISTRLALGNAFAHMSNFASLLSIDNLNSVVVALLGLCSAVVEILGIIAIIYITTHHEEGTIFHAVEESITYFWRFILLSFVIFLFSLVGLIVGFIPVWLISIALAFIMHGNISRINEWIDYIANAVSALTAMFFVFSPYIMIQKNISIISSLKESARIVRSHFWRVLVAFCLLSILGFLLSFTLLYIPRIGSTLSVLVITPFSTIYAFVFYCLITGNPVMPATVEAQPTTQAPEQPTSTPTTPA